MFRWEYLAWMKCWAAACRWDIRCSLVGPSGSGKTILATEFLAEGVRRGEPGVIAAFEKSPSQLLNNKLYALVKAGTSWGDQHAFPGFVD